MLHRFATFEEAAIFVSCKRDEGYFAEILHGHVASLWGPMPVGGVAAWVSEEHAGEDDQVPEIDCRLASLPPELSQALGATILAVPAIYFAWLLFNVPGLLMALPLVVLAAGICGGLMAVLGWLMACWMQRFRDFHHRGHEWARMFFWVLVAAVVAASIGSVPYY